ncbi:molybdenum cofactor biosynthesis protein B [Methanohalophilus levihalophilus]|uniref:MogA/MoaB family molybdenum cofactor biosynthesis protein n=1 Tax=Methanohalophilus levihalophilus TaxID=1431282 RepID=UPI001AE136C2|nr:MogA/MoaB family molybdenum cofactor biosynthesis protein [Methanohalophilus levihalophilus]MBP2030842.1 molybdenum cofactor biosynthesis protein B [Methanohalophilus levihalophilus]
MTSVVEEHKKGTLNSYKFAVITVSTSRYNDYGSVDSPAKAEDISGEKMIRSIEKEGNNVIGYSLVSDDIDLIRAAVRGYLGTADVIVTSGGTGLAASDVTIEALTPLFSKSLPGFGELFRYKSIDQIGSAVILTRAAAGISDGTAIFCLPGSPKAVELAMEEIILPEAGHIMRHLPD